jgi:hypothetical protein
MFLSGGPPLLLHNLILLSGGPPLLLLHKPDAFKWRSPLLLYNLMFLSGGPPLLLHNLMLLSGGLPFYYIT